MIENPSMYGQARGGRRPRLGLAAGLLAALTATAAPETLRAQTQDGPVAGPVAEYHDLLLPRTTGGGLEPEAEIGAPPPPGTEPGEWPLARRDFALSAFSPLDQINRENVKDLKVAWTFATGELHGHEAAPIVVEGVMYVITPYPNRVYALDIENQGQILWSYHPHVDTAARGACCDVVNAASPTWTGASSSTRSTRARSRSTARPASCSGRPASATSTRARR